ncbi:MAG: V-type ATPase subunit [Faecalibacterium sp.]|nr:V-type ATPase subunit [Ruminococcus sp.]MCM1392074.1 V-type ATPase subunit [Ruminococcus sp.]MCM1484999.1 V-type ATPase subunit [Faecalibacterium sp.]
MRDEDYAYAVARIRANERNLLTNSDIEQLVKCKTFDDTVNFLKSKGWIPKDGNGFDISDAVAFNQKKLWTLLCESVPDKDELNIFTVQNDFFNIKAALKCMITSQSADRLFTYPTSLDLDKINESIKKHDFSSFDESFEEAYKIACQTQNGQNMEIILDRAALACIQKLAKKSKCALVREVTDFLCAVAIIKTAYRCAKTKKGLSFAQSAIAPCRLLDSDILAKLSVKGEAELLEYLDKTDFSVGVRLLGENSAAFEKWCDDTVTEMTKKAKFIFFGFEPILAYYYAKQAEIKTVRIILGAKQSGIAEEIIRERVRTLYV